MQAQREATGGVGEGISPPYHRGAAIRRLGLVAVNLAVIFGIEGAVLGVEVLRSHGQDEAIFLSLKARGVIAAVRVDHALGERS